MLGENYIKGFFMAAAQGHCLRPSLFSTLCTQGWPDILLSAQSASQLDEEIEPRLFLLASELRKILFQKNK